MIIICQKKNECLLIILFIVTIKLFSPYLLMNPHYINEEKKYFLLSLIERCKLPQETYYSSKIFNFSIQYLYRA